MPHSWGGILFCSIRSETQSRLEDCRKAARLCVCIFFKKRIARAQDSPPHSYERQGCSLPATKSEMKNSQRKLGAAGMRAFRQQTYCYYMRTDPEEVWPYMGISFGFSFFPPLFSFPSNQRSTVGLPFVLYCLETFSPMLKMLMYPVCRHHFIWGEMRQPGL